MIGQIARLIFNIYVIIRLILSGALVEPPDDV